MREKGERKKHSDWIKWHLVLIEIVYFHEYICIYIWTAWKILEVFQTESLTQTELAACVPLSKHVTARYFLYWGTISYSLKNKKNVERLPVKCWRMLSLIPKYIFILCGKIYKVDKKQWHLKMKGPGWKQYVKAASKTPITSWSFVIIIVNLG